MLILHWQKSIFLYWNYANMSRRVYGSTRSDTIYFPKPGDFEDCCHVFKPCLLRNIFLPKVLAIGVTLDLPSQTRLSGDFHLQFKKTNDRHLDHMFNKHVVIQGITFCLPLKTGGISRVSTQEHTQGVGVGKRPGGVLTEFLWSLPMPGLNGVHRGSVLGPT